eukprot:TRINITY_DN7249_c0_g1_i1.p1 TRINITY_DN7249_c0_g1~~TRINITY_DN7249_c0_g1_i1.p1  ORF type:complete len:119 (+),score=37.07 TRINITY_DN7249_c0_g1_i1:15-371(+)
MTDNQDQQVGREHIKQDIEQEIEHKNEVIDKNEGSEGNKEGGEEEEECALCAEAKKGPCAKEFMPFEECAKASIKANSDPEECRESFNNYIKCMISKGGLLGFADGGDEEQEGDNNKG